MNSPKLSVAELGGIQEEEYEYYGSSMRGSQSNFHSKKRSIPNAKQNIMASKKLISQKEDVLTTTRDFFDANKLYLKSSLMIKKRLRWLKLK